MPLWFSNDDNYFMVRESCTNYAGCRSVVNISGDLFVDDYGFCGCKI